MVEAQHLDYLFDLPDKHTLSFQKKTNWNLRPSSVNKSYILHYDIIIGATHKIIQYILLFRLICMIKTDFELNYIPEAACLYKDSYGR